MKKKKNEKNFAKEEKKEFFVDRKIKKKIDDEQKWMKTQRQTKGRKFEQKR